METYKEYLNKQIESITYNRIIEATLANLKKVGIDETKYMPDVVSIRNFMRESLCEDIDIHRCDDIIRNPEESTVYEIDEEDTGLLLGAVREETGLPVDKMYIHEIDKDTLTKMILKQKLMNSELEASHKGYTNDDVSLEVQMEADGKQALHIYCTSIRLQYLRLHTYNVKASLISDFNPVIDTLGTKNIKFSKLVKENLKMFDEAQHKVNETVNKILDEYGITSTGAALEILNNIKTALRTGNKQWLMLG